MVNLNLSKAALAKLLEYFERAELENHVATLAWATDGTDTRGNRLGPHWSIGFYERTKVADEPIVNIQGINFVFMQPWKIADIEGKTLDFRNGRFFVE